MAYCRNLNPCYPKLEDIYLLSHQKEVKFDKLSSEEAFQISNICNLIKLIHAVSKPTFFELMAANKVDNYRWNT